MKNPLITMSAITGKPTRFEIFDYLKSLSENGIGGLMIYPRSGCELEYLSEEWFSTVKNIIEGSEELGLDVWLYDDFNWPSGDAGGRITVEPKHRLLSITVEGDKVGEIKCASTNTGSLFNEKYFANLLSGEATDRFIDLTHEEYYRRFGRYFGNVIKGIFTDEPAIAYSCAKGDIPYYEGMEKDYSERYGRDFYEDLASDKTGLVKRSMKILSERFAKCYLGKISEWCHSHGIASTGHLMMDDSPIGATLCSGNYLENLTQIDIPGIDEIETDLKGERLMHLLGGIEYASARNGGAMAEIFALGPSDMSYAKKRAMITLLSAFKVNKYFLAISYIDMRGSALITDFFNSITRDQPDFFGMRKFSEYASGVASSSERDYTADVYIRYPSDIGAMAHVFGGEDAVGRYFEFINGLSYSGVQWKFIGDESPSDAPIIEFTEGFTPHLNGNEITADGILATLGKRPAVTSDTGDAVRGIFVRRYNNGDALVINAFAKEGDYTVLGNRMHLYEYGVAEIKNGAFSQECAAKEKIECEFNISYKNPNLQRIMYVNGEKEALICSDTDVNVILAVRNGADAELDGAPILATERADVLPDGMKNLYRASDIIHLSAGEHCVRAGNDLKYLPTVLVSADASMRYESGKISRLIISDRAKNCRTGDGIYDFGRLVFGARVYIPEDAEYLRIGMSALAVTLRVNGDEKETKIYPPYDFDIASYAGTCVDIEIEQASSIGPIFGDTDYFDTHSEFVKWRGTPATSLIPFGISEIQILKKP